MTVETPKAEPVDVGDYVRVVDERYQPHDGLVTAVHGSFEQMTPCINVVYVSNDESKHDSNGRQIERLSSLQHFTQGPSLMPTPGRYWTNA